MFVTALVDLPPFGPDAARRLSLATGLSLRQAAERLQVPLRGPAVVGNFIEKAAADAQIAALSMAGFRGFVLGPPWPEAVQARQLVVVGDDLVALFEANRREVIRGDTLPVVIWGTRVLPPGALVERGPGATSEQPRHRRLPTEQREGFLRLFPHAGPIIRVESGVVAGLDDHAFTLLARAVKRACAQAAFDDRLLARRTQEQILGADLKPDGHLDLAVLLVARARGWTPGNTSHG